MSWFGGVVRSVVRSGLRDFEEVGTGGIGSGRCHSCRPMDLSGWKERIGDGRGGYRKVYDSRKRY